METLKLFPNLFYDFICRIVPGFALILLYKPGVLVVERPLLPSIGLVVAAWTLGLSLDVLSETLIAFVPKKLLGSLNPQKEKLNGSVNLLDLDTRLSVLRAMAERALFRVLFVVSLVTLLTIGLPSSFTDMLGIPEISGVVSDHPVLVLIATIGFYCCWRYQGKKVDNEYDEANKLLKAKATSPRT